MDTGSTAKFFPATNWSAFANAPSPSKRSLIPGVRYWFGGRGDGNAEKRENATPEERRLASWGVNEITRPELLDIELVNVFAHPRVYDVMNGILDQPRAWGIKMLWSPKLVGYDLGWHRDQMPAEFYDWIQYKPEPCDHVQFNGALNEDQCFLVVPGSHRRALTEEEWHVLREGPSNSDLPGQVLAELEPGDILYMDAHALHRGRSAITENRLTLHYSAQAQWTALKPWGQPEHFEFITSDAFIEQLHPKAQEYYVRLRTAARTEKAIDFAYEAASEHGYVAAT